MPVYNPLVFLMYAQSRLEHQTHSRRKNDLITLIRGDVPIKSQRSTKKASVFIDSTGDDNNALYCTVCIVCSVYTEIDYI
jgi:hypothetical protein